MRTSPRSPALFLTVALATVVALTPTSAAHAAAPDFDALLGDRPFARLWTEAGACDEVSDVNSLTGDALDRRLDQLTTWFEHFNSQGANQFLLGRDCIGSGSSTLAAKLSARGVVVSTYRNGSATSQSSRLADLNFLEAADVERNAPLGIATFWPGDWRPNAGGDGTAPGARLTRALSATDDIVRVRGVGTDRPPGTIGTWPYFTSRGAGLASGAFSQNTHDVVSWIRVEDELMKIVEPPTIANGVVTLHVQRGLWATDGQSHDAGTRVMSPVYVGSASEDAHLSGVPSLDDGDIPLRYSLKVWTIAAQRWLIDRIRATFGDTWQGYNAVWLDITSCVQYSTADPFGNKVFGWDERTDAKLNSAGWGRAQRVKIAAIREAFPGKQVFANNLISPNACTEQLLAEVDGGAFEHWLSWQNGRPFDWRGAVRQLIEVQRNDWPAMLWVRWEGWGGATRYRRLTYGTYLLARRAGAVRTRYGGPWELSRPEHLYFWQWGAPEVPATSIDDLRVPGTTLFRREYANGVIFVNPGTTSVTYALGGTYYDVANRTTGGTPRAVTSITVPARDAAFLLRSA